MADLADLVAEKSQRETVSIEERSSFGPAPFLPWRTALVSKVKILTVHRLSSDYNMSMLNKSPSIYL